MALFSKLRSSLSKTRENLVVKVSKVLKGRANIDDDVLNDLEEVLITADVGVETSMQIIGDLKTRAKKEKYRDASEIETLIRDEVTRFVSEATDGRLLEDRIAEATPFVILIVGVNGTGKTTTIGKLAHRFREQGRKVMIVASDTFRAGAIEQLDIWATRSGVDIIKQAEGSDPASVAFNALQAALAKGTDVVIVDTAGRLQNQKNLMEELSKIDRVIKKQIPDAPHETLLVLDANTGQNAVSQAKEFVKTAGVTGLVLTKLDGTAKGGVVIGINRELNLPVRYIGIGESIGDLETFEPKRFVEALFD